MGFVDQVSERVISGWCLASSIVVTVNGQERCRLACSRYREDVKAAGLSATGHVGFMGRLALAHGDIVRVVTEQGAPLRHTPWLFCHPDHGEWLPASLSNGHPEYAAMAALPGKLPLNSFKPLFGQAGQQMVGAVIKGRDQSPVVVRFNVKRAAHENVAALYRRVLAPGGVSAPPLLAAYPQQNTMMQVFAFQPGITLDTVGSGWEAWVPHVMAQLGALQQEGRAAGAGLTRRASWLRSFMYKLFPLVVANALQERSGRRELAFLFRLRRLVTRLPQVLSHGDLHRNNVLIDTEQGTVGLIDWDRWGYLPVGFDAALLLRGLPGLAVEALIQDTHENQLGALVFTYLFQSLDVEGFVGSDDADRLRARIQQLVALGIKQ